MQGHSAQQWVASNQTPTEWPASVKSAFAPRGGDGRGPGEGGLGEKHMLWQIFQGEYQVNSCCFQMIA